MPIERRDILFFFPEVQFALQRCRHAPGREVIPAEIDDCAIIEAMHTARAHHVFHEQRKRMLAGIAPELASQRGVVFRATRSAGALLRSTEINFFIPEPVVGEALAIECRSRGIMLPAGAAKEVIVDALTIGLRIAIGDDTQVS